MKAPKIRFKGFEGAWDIKNLWNNSKISTWTCVTDKETSDNYKYPVISGWKDIMWYYFEYNRKPNTITIARAWTAWFVQLIKTPFYLNDKCFSVISNNEIFNTNFLFFSLKNSEKNIMNLRSSTSVPTINTQHLNSLQISLPSLPEQEKIWALFEQLDLHINKNQQKLEKLKNMKHFFLQKLFPKDWAALPELRFKGFERAWEESELDKKAVFWKGNWYSKNDLTEEWNKIVLYGRLYTKYETIIKDIDTFCFKKENSILSKWWELVVPASWETAEDIARASVINQKGIILWWDLNIIYPTSEINSVFLALNITYWIPHNDMAKRAQWKSVVHIRNSDLWKIILNYPKVKEQEKIWAFFEKLDTQITQQTQKIKKLQNLKQSLLEKMFI